jgi:hypothetical protein
MLTLSTGVLDWGGTGGIRAFKWMGPKPSQTRKTNSRAAQRRVTGNLDVLRSFAPPRVKMVKKVALSSKRATIAGHSEWKEVPERGIPGMQ